jgi:acyl-coenzyme A synthetase/AMP-(fatty) acid ligase
LGLGYSLLTPQISSEEVENAIYLDDRVAEAAAVPVPDDLLGELVAVAVSLRPGTKVTPEEIIKGAHSRYVFTCLTPSDVSLRSHARPIFVYVADDLLRE